TPSHAERYHLIRACEDSLHRLKTDHIDIYTMHGFEPLTQTRMKPPPQSADPRSLEGVPLRMGDVPHGLRAWRAGRDLDPVLAASRPGSCVEKLRATRQRW